MILRRKHPNNPINVLKSRLGTIVSAAIESRRNIKVIAPPHLAQSNRLLSSPRHQANRAVAVFAVAHSPIISLIVNNVKRERIL